jgi:hypothetical protein
MLRRRMFWCFMLRTTSRGSICKSPPPAMRDVAAVLSHPRHIRGAAASDGASSGRIAHHRAFTLSCSVGRKALDLGGSRAMCSGAIRGHGCQLPVLEDGFAGPSAPCTPTRCRVRQPPWGSICSAVVEPRGRVYNLKTMSVRAVASWQDAVKYFEAPHPHRTSAPSEPTPYGHTAVSLPSDSLEPFVPPIVHRGLFTAAPCPWGSPAQQDAVVGHPVATGCALSLDGGRRAPVTSHLEAAVVRMLWSGP